MATLDLKEYARRGAELRVRELNAELAEIFRTFPDLRSAPPAGYTDDGASLRRGGRKRTRRNMSAAARKAVSVRMKKYWAARRKEAK